MGRFDALAAPSGNVCILRGAVASDDVTDVFVGGKMYHQTGKATADCAYVPRAIGDVNVRSA